jgi:hypothetical protein
MTRLDKFHEAESGSRVVHHPTIHSTGNAQVDCQSMIAHITYIRVHTDPTYFYYFIAFLSHHYTSAILLLNYAILLCYCDGSHVNALWILLTSDDIHLMNRYSV